MVHIVYSRRLRYREFHYDRLADAVSNRQKICFPRARSGASSDDQPLRRSVQVPHDKKGWQDARFVVVAGVDA